MFRKLFKKSKNKSEALAAATKTAHALTDKAAMQMAIVINRLQNGFASFLNKKTKHFSGRTWKVLIIVFGACWGLFSFYIFSSALLPSSEKSTQPVRKSMPAHLIVTPKRNDSLEYLEMLYDLRKSIEEQHRFDTMNIK